MKPTNHLCPQCGFRLDPDNPSESVCPACGTDPHDGHRPLQDLLLAAVLEDAASAETLQTANEILDADALGEPEVATLRIRNWISRLRRRGLLKALTDGPILVAGNGLIN